jgi:hypothetical protein
MSTQFHLIHLEFCSNGGLYFTDVSHFGSFRNYGNKIALVQIPNDARVCYENDKWKADKIIILERTSYKEFF